MKGNDGKETPFLGHFEQQPPDISFFLIRSKAIPVTGCEGL
jgi:hypothetical protein